NMPNPLLDSKYKQRLLDDARIEATHLIRSSLDDGHDDLVQAALARVFPQIDPAQGMAALHGISDGEWPGIRLVAAEELPGAHAAYVADLDLILVSESVLEIEAAEPGFLAGVLLEEVGHFLDDQYSPVDTEGDEGAAFRALIQSGGSIVIDAGGDEDEGVITLEGEDYVAEFAS